jgi:hypothetical protein
MDMSKRPTLIGLSAAVALAAALPAVAQTTTPAQYEWTRRLTAHGFVGASSIPPDAGFTGGAGVGWGIARRWLVEGSAGWFNLPPGANAYGASITALVSLTNRRPALPFLRFGVGMYAASYDTSRVDPPDFYARRFDAAAGPAGEEKSFRDPSIVAGGGVHLLMARNWGVRPEVEVTVALDGRHAYTVVSGVIRVAYHFEQRQITPARAGRR